MKHNYDLIPCKKCNKVPDIFIWPQEPRTQWYIKCEKCREGLGWWRLPEDGHLMVNDWNGGIRWC